MLLAAKEHCDCATAGPRGDHELQVWLAQACNRPNSAQYEHEAQDYDRPVHAIEMLQAAWMAVPASTVTNCFRHASFGVSSGGDSEDLSAAATEGAAGDQALASWDALLGTGIVPDRDTFCTYVTADADAVTTEELTEPEIVHAATGVPDDNSDECVDSPEPNVGGRDVPTPAQALDAADLLRRFFGAHDDGEDRLEIAAAAEKAIIRLKKTG